MQSIYAKPKGSREHRCIAVFLFKFSQSSGNQIPLTTWHRVVRPDNIEMEMISEPSSILPTQSETLARPEATGWQPNFSDLVPRNTRSGLPIGEERPFDANKAYLDEYCNGIAEVDILPCFTTSTEPNGYYGEVSLRNSGLNANMIEGTYGLSKYSEIACRQEPPSGKLQLTRSSSHQTSYHPAYFDDLIYTQGSADLKIQEMDLASLNTDHISLEALNEADRMIAAHIEALDFDFNQPLAMPFGKNGYGFKIDSNDNVLYKTTETSQIYAFEPRSFDAATEPSSRILASQLSEKDDRNNFTQNGFCSQLIQTSREEESSTNDYHDANQMALCGGYHSLTNKASVTYNSEASHHCEYDILPSSHGILQDNAHELGTDSQQTKSTFQILETTRSGSPQQSSLLPPTYRHEANSQRNTPDLVPQDAYLDELELFSCEAHHGQMYRALPTPPPSHDLSTATSISCQDDMPRDSQQAHDGLLDWSTSIDLETHQWVVELAIAKTEDMIEEACANYTNGQNVKTIQGVADVEGMAALLGSFHEGIDPDQQNTAANNPLGRILGEVETNDKSNTAKPEHGKDYDSILPHLESIPVDKIIESQQEDINPPSNYPTNNETVSQPPSRDERTTILGTEWLSPYNHNIFPQKEPSTQPNNESFNQTQNNPETHHNLPNTSLNTSSSTPEPSYQNLHYNSPQSIHSPPPSVQNQSSAQNQPSNQNQTTFNQFPSDTTDSISEQHGLTLQILGGEQGNIVFTPQSIEIEMSDVEDDVEDDEDLTERIAFTVEEEVDRQSQGPYHIISSENGSFTSSELERDNEWEKIEYDDLTMNYAPAPAAALDDVPGNADQNHDGMALYHH